MYNSLVSQHTEAEISPSCTEKPYRLNIKSQSENKSRSYELSSFFILLINEHLFEDREC